MTRIIPTTAALLLVSAISVNAQAVDKMPSEYLDGVAAKLLMAGFHDIRVIDLEQNKLGAYDAWGSEVVLVVHPTSRKIMMQNFVHAADE